MKITTKEELIKELQTIKNEHPNIDLRLYDTGFTRRYISPYLGDTVSSFDVRFHAVSDILIDNEFYLEINPTGIIEEILGY